MINSFKTFVYDQILEQKLGAIVLKHCTALHSRWLHKFRVYKRILKRILVFFFKLTLMEREGKLY